MRRYGKYSIKESFLNLSNLYDIGQHYDYGVFNIKESNYKIFANDPIINKQNAFKSVVLEAYIISENRLYYSYDVLLDFINVSYEMISNKRMLGYLEHPSENSISYYLPNPKDDKLQITHYVHSLELSNGKVIGTFVLFDNVPDVMQIKSWLSERIPFGVSIRADIEGYETTPRELVKEGYRIINRYYIKENMPKVDIREDDTKIIRITKFLKVYGIDITLNPSVHNASVIYSTTTTE